MADFEVPPQVEREFDEQLDEYMADWEAGLREHLRLIDEDAPPPSSPPPAAEREQQESFDESRAGELMRKAAEILFDPEQGIYP